MVQIKCAKGGTRTLMTLRSQHFECCAATNYATLAYYCSLHNYYDKINPLHIVVHLMQNPTHYFENSVFWIEVEKIKPNPYQPRREFDEARLRDLAESIRMYGVLQPLIVTRREFEKPDGGLAVEYELISGERRLRASKLAGLSQVPTLIRNGEEDARIKLEIAIIENLQREDINSVDRARAFDRLIKEFGMKHLQIAEKVGKSREYVTNTLRILALPDEILNAISEGKLSEGHTRPLLMLIDRPEEQMTLFKEIVIRKISVREAEALARRVAVDRVRKKDWSHEPEIAEMEKKFKEILGTKVSINKSELGGRITIDFFTADDVRNIFERIVHEPATMNVPFIGKVVTPVSPATAAQVISDSTPLEVSDNTSVASAGESSLPTGSATKGDLLSPRGGGANEDDEKPLDDRSRKEVVKDENEELYSIKNFGV